MITIRFSKSEQNYYNALEVEFIKNVNNAIESVNPKINFGLIIEDGKVVGIEKEL